ncbi:MAG: response regulator [Candidatus Devosia phytovorans]|uniref:Response regulator n=1 Tax=Candidatus Devosia phytovorans TaxID=3121372 RepID=A0AAJ6AZ93_9HYPH|nr:response regulator [Devosia sp.]WEK04355.1 MAG: response regulator [Devosia sp.]
MVTVLVVDDSKLARIVAGKTIAALQPDWTRIEASNADEALETVRTQSVDIAVLDYNMPGKDGLELAAELRAAHPLMPIAIITANVQNEIIAQARELNATFVGKPVTEDTIRGFLSGAALRLRQTGDAQ